VQQARALLEFLAQSFPADSAYGMILRQELEVIRQQPDAYLFHDHLEENNEPVYFHQFVEAAQRHGLQYLAEAIFGSMLVSNFAPQVGETLRRVAPDVVRMEQYIDFLRNQSFRQTLLVHQNVAVNRQLDPRIMQGFYVASPAQPLSLAASVAPGASESFRAPNGATIATSNAITKAALLLLAERWPLGLTFEQLVAGSRTVLADSRSEADTFAKDAHILGNDLLQSYAADAVELRMRAPPMTTMPSARPIASPLARLQADRGSAITNLRHEPVEIDAFGLRLLSLLDGTRDRDALASELFLPASGAMTPELQSERHEAGDG